MFQKMRRNKQALSQDACATILYRCTSGVLALSGDDGYPYAVPISYVYDGEKLSLRPAFCKMELIFLSDKMGRQNQHANDGG